MTVSSLKLACTKAMSWVKTEPNGVWWGSRRVSLTLRSQVDKRGDRNRRFLVRTVSLLPG